MSDCCSLRGSALLGARRAGQDGPALIPARAVKRFWCVDSGNSSWSVAAPSRDEESPSRHCGRSSWTTAAGRSTLLWEVFQYRGRQALRGHRRIWERAWATNVLDALTPDVPRGSGRAWATADERGTCRWCQSSGGPIGGAGPAPTRL
jgi:hypothetical protein